MPARCGPFCEVSNAHNEQKAQCIVGRWALALRRRSGAQSGGRGTGCTNAGGHGHGCGVSGWRPWLHPPSDAAEGGSSSGSCVFGRATCQKILAQTLDRRRSIARGNHIFNVPAKEGGQPVLSSSASLPVCAGSRTDSLAHSRRGEPWSRKKKRRCSRSLPTAI